MKKNYKLLALVLALIMLFGSFACKDRASTENGSESESDVALGEGEFIPSDEFSLVCPALYRSNADMVDALEYLKQALLSVYGIKGYISADDKTSEREHEMIIGKTSREESKAVAGGLLVGQYAYSIESEKSIVICGGSLQDTVEGIYSFCKDVIGYEGSDEGATEKTVLKVGTRYTSERPEYPYEKLSLGGVPIEEYKIAVSHGRDTKFAEMIVDSIGALTGKAPEVVHDESLSGDEGAVFCIGAFDRTMTERLPNGLIGYSVRFDFSDGKITVGIDADKADSYLDAVAALKAVLTPDESGNVTLPSTSISEFDYKIDPNYTPDWIEESSSVEMISEGVEYKEFLYLDPDQNPYRAYAVIVDPKLNSIYMGSSKDGYEYAPEIKQTVAGHMSEAAANGLDVIAGVNADFFAISSDYHPTGIAIKEGELISEGAAGRPYFAFTKDGRGIIGNNGADADLEEIRTAVGASHVLVSNSIMQSFNMSDSFSYTSHPRTLAGVTEDGKIILAVIDGRQPSVSNGASLERCALFMLSLGAAEAVNLDGGGSSTMVVERDGEMVAENSGSDGTLRKIYNSLIVIKN